MRKFFLTIIILISFFDAKSIGLSDSLQVSILTELPGTELYSTFGHTAIRIKDLKNGYDLAFNYGMFDFSTSYFYFKFALGGLDYMIGVESYDGFVAAAQEENRSIIEQVLNFNKKQKVELAAFLIKNYEPQNRFYRYKFFTDNCSTRVRDALALVAGDSLILRQPEIKSNVTFQKLYTAYLEDLPWSKFGIGLLLGTLTQKEAGYDALFLPDNLKEAIGKAKISGESFVLSEKEILPSVPSLKKTNWFSPLMMALLILLASILVQFKSKWIFFFDKAFFTAFGLLALFIATLSIFSHHAELHKNYVLLFLLPTHIILVFLPNGNFKMLYCLITLLLLILFFLLIPLIPQSFGASFLVMMMAVGVRLFFNYKLNSKLK